MIVVMLTKLSVSASALFVITGTFLKLIFKFQQKLCNGCFDEGHNHYFKVILEQCSNE